MNIQTGGPLSPSRLPAILLAISLKERLLIALHAGPQTMPQLEREVATPAKQVYRVIDRMRHERLVRRLGVRRTAVWALASYRGRAPKQDAAPAAARKRVRTVPAPDPGSWWVTSPERFATTARQRAEAMGWDK